ncbi:dihydroneopterin aldolase [Zhihengliuella salsuginis]|uniref:7,8-dihydroneopterin aldolase n=1 Tax=Zhihengliuella salsuginis TaxID=578222 RepID=A0ABQ3GLC7_9MICC|nr:dihydroneopterin aldolase [Zhihengliuella salsuginis]GHD10779.1 7,8-dihydroneopterin aldolase [Zhihengliuella salsuginis]
MADRITLTGITATGHHGVFEHEKREGQPFVVDVVLHTDIRPAAAGDDLTRTTHYGELAELVVQHIESGPFDLIETLTENIAAAVLGGFERVDAVDVTVHKPKAPIEVPFGDVAITIHRERDGSRA